MGSGNLVALRRDWTKLGESDPLWAVCVDPAKRDGRWNIEELLASGRAEVAAALAGLDRLGSCALRGIALDFGCGVGRLTGALSDHFMTVIGVDIAEPMLRRARSLHSANSRCHFILNDRADLKIFADDSFDLVYSSLVLQHVSPQLADGYLAEFIRVVRPGGAIVLLVPERHLRTPRGLVYAYAPPTLVGWLQRVFFGFPAPMQMHSVPAWRVRRVVEPRGAQLLASAPRARSGHWRMAAHFIAVDHAASDP